MCNHWPSDSEAAKRELKNASGPENQTCLFPLFTTIQLKFIEAFFVRTHKRQAKIVKIVENLIHFKYCKYTNIKIKLFEFQDSISA